jgi:hypothetical protein
LLDGGIIQTILDGLDIDIIQERADGNKGEKIKNKPENFFQILIFNKYETQN